MMSIVKKLAKYLLGDRKALSPVVKMDVSWTLPADRFKGKNVLITDGSSGIGLEIARQFLAEGATVLITGRKEESLQKAEKELNNTRLQTIVWDVSDLNHTSEYFAKALQLTECFDIFVNNAGICELGSWDTFDTSTFDQHVDVNTKGLFFMCQQEGKYLTDNAIKGKIINITSIAGTKPSMDSYSVSKWGATCITKGLAKELVKYGITVNGIAIGNVETSISENFDGEVANITLFIASGAANNIVGQFIVVDGSGINI